MSSSALFFEPWIGPHYAQLQQERSRGVLKPTVQAWPFHVMGESHYGEPHEYEPGFTRHVVEKCGYAPSRCSCFFFAKILQIVTGRHVNELDRKDQWRKIAFSNYVQDLLPKSRKAPSEAEWERGRNAFLEQLLLTKAQVLVVLGSRLWKRLPREFALELAPLISMDRHMEVTDPPVRAYIYSDGGANRVTLAVSVTHPSGRGFDWRHAHKRAFTTALYYSNVSCSDAVDAYELA